MENIVVVGTGDVFHRFIAPSLEILEHQNLLKILATVDIKKRGPLEYLSEKIEYRIRTPDQSLPDLLNDLKEKDPIVILAHDNDLHYQDTRELVSAGFRVMLEKPYVVSKNQLDSLKKINEENPEKIFLMEYYLMRKMSPLFLLSGAINPKSFYVGTEEVFREREVTEDLSLYSGKLREIVGDPVSARINILESQRDSGKLDHRGAHVFDVRRGGGMIQDMGIHSIIPLFVLEEYLGKVDKSFSDGKVRTARCHEFDEIAGNTYNIPEKFRGETYAEMDISTNKGIPIKISVGKYIADSHSQKNFVIQGTRGKVDLNMHENYMNIYRGNTLLDRIDLVNTKRHRYYPVIRTGLEFFAGNNPLSIDLSSTQLNTQELTLNIVGKARENSNVPKYDGGEIKSNIFTDG
jgi:predicted dehydrogenase